MSPVLSIFRTFLIYVSAICKKFLIMAPPSGLLQENSPDDPGSHRPVFRDDGNLITTRPFRCQ